MSNNPTRLTVIPNLLVEHGRVDRSMRDQETISDAMREAGWNPSMTSARVFIDGKFIEQAYWEHMVPARGSSIVIRRVPMGGGGGGGGGKQVGMLIGMIAVMALAWYAAPLLVGAAGMLGGMSSAIGVASALTSAGGIAGLALSAGVGIAGMLAVRALVPPALPTLKEIAHDEKSVSVLPQSGWVDRYRRSAEYPGLDRRRAGMRSRSRLADRTLVADLR